LPGLFFGEQDALPFGSQKLARLGIARLVPEMQAAIAAASATTLHPETRSAEANAFIL